MSLTKEQILAAEDMKREKVSVPEWGGHVWVKTLTGAEQDAWEDSRIQQTQRGGQRTVQTNLRNLRASFCALVLCDSEGQALFTNADVAALGTKSAAALDRVYKAGQSLNRLTDEDVDDLLGNSGGAPDDSSGSS